MSSEDEEDRARIQSNISAVDDYLISLSPPMEFEGTNNALVVTDKGFERLVFLMEQSGVRKPKELSVYEFYTKVGLIEDQNRPTNG